MLQKKLDEAAMQGARVVASATVLGRPAPVEHGRAIVHQVVPSLRDARARLLDLVGRTIAELQQALRRNDLDAARGQFEASAALLFGAMLEWRTLSAEAIKVRELLAQDMAQVQLEIARLNVIVAQRTQQAAEANAKIREHALRTSLTWLGGPLAKLIDEIVSLAQSGGLTEMQLADGVRELKQAQREVENASAASGALSALADGMGSLASTVQGLANTLALAIGHMQNAVADLTEASLLELFVTTAIQDLEDVRRDAA